MELVSLLPPKAARPNIFLKIPATPPGIPAIVVSIGAGVPINVTLLFSTAQYLAAAEAYLRGIERRIAAGLDPVVESVASVFVSRWDKAIAKTAPEALRNGLGIAVGMQCYREYRALLASPRWKALEAAGARPQRLLWASTSTKDPAAPDTLYAVALAAPDTIDTLPAKTLEALADHGRAGAPMAVDGGDAEARLRRYADAGIDVDALAKQLQEEGAKSFVESWTQLLQRIRTKVETLS
jgi:transaldolase